MDQTYCYLQNSSKLQLCLNRGISKQWIETKRWSDKSSGSERHVDICLSSLSLPFPSFYCLPRSDQRDRNPPQQLSVQTDSVNRFPSIFLSLAHTHTQITSLRFCTQMHFSPLTPLANKSGSHSKMKTGLSGVLSALSGHMSPADHKKILWPAVLANTHTWNDKRSDKDTHSIMHRSTSTYLLFPTRSTRLLSVLMPSVMGDDCTACYLFR